MWAVAMAWAQTVSGAGVTASWTVTDGVLEGEARARTTGWVAVGFHTQPELAGSVLLLGAATPDGTSEVVEHIAQPPNHPDRSTLGTPGLLAASAEEVAGWTTIRFRLRLDTGDGWGGELRAGAPVYVTLAWSRADAFDHHSAARTLVPTTL